MNGHEVEDNKCRVCWEENVELNWNDLLSGHSHLTYKDCYYKFTQLDIRNEEDFSNLICRNCSNGLEYIEAFISKAIDTHVKLQNLFFINKTESISKTICLEEIEIKEEIQSSKLSDDTCKQVCTPLESKNGCNLEISAKPLRNNQMSTRTAKIKIKVNRSQKKSVIYEEKSKELIQDTFKIGRSSKRKKQQLLQNSNEKLKSTKPKLIETEFIEMKENNCEIYESTSGVELDLNKISDTKPTVPFQKTPAKNSEDNKQIYLCQFCSLQLKGLSSLKLHEALHSRDRKRTEICPQCGVKFFNKQSLRLHLKTHDSKREKKFKCEFCEKSFFNNSTLNVHKRIHLGLMVKCHICSKEFFRKIELLNHMKSHSCTLINVEVKKRSRYMVRCKYCSKEILSTSFKSHTAAHLNQPLMKCSICNKEFFRRDSCRHHLKTIHKIKTGEMKDLIILYDKNRLNHLYLRQTADIQQNKD